MMDVTPYGIVPISERLDSNSREWNRWLKRGRARHTRLTLANFDEFYRRLHPTPGSNPDLNVLAEYTN